MSGPCGQKAMLSEMEPGPTRHAARARPSLRGGPVEYQQDLTLTWYYDTRTKELWAVPLAWPPHRQDSLVAFSLGMLGVVATGTRCECRLRSLARETGQRWPCGWDKRFRVPGQRGAHPFPEGVPLCATASVLGHCLWVLPPSTPLEGPSRRGRVRGGCTTHQEGWKVAEDKQSLWCMVEGSRSPSWGPCPRSSSSTYHQRSAPTWAGMCTYCGRQRSEGAHRQG